MQQFSLKVIVQRFACGIDEEGDYRQMLLDLGPFLRSLRFCFVTNRFQQIRQSGETATRVAVAGTRSKHNVTALF